MHWLNVIHLQPAVWGAVLLFVVASLILFAHLTRIRKRLLQLHEDLETNNNKLRVLFEKAHKINSSNGNARRTN